MIRYHILEGDVTTAGGVVQRHTGSGQTFIWHGKLTSNLGDKVSCPACGSVGYIAPKGLRRPFDNMKQAPALDGDLCICKCNPPPELKNSQTTLLQNVAGGIIVNNFKSPLNFNLPNLQQDLNSHLVQSQEEKCFCNRDLDLEFLQLVLPNDVLSKGLFYRSQYPKIKNLSMEALLILLNKAMSKFEINTCLRKAHFLAQIACEGDMFRTTEEYKNGNGSIPKHWYGYRGGHEYHGRGLIQLTHIENYKSYGTSVGIQFDLNNINLVASEPEYVVNSAAWYWLKGSAWGNGNKYADLDDVHYVTMLVNGGFNHYCDRKRNLLNLIKKMRIKELCPKTENLGNSLGVYDFKTSKLANTKVGKSKWTQYHTTKALMPYVSCESK